MSAFAILLAAATAVPEVPPTEEPQRGDDIIVTGTRTEGGADYAVKAQTTATRLPLSQRETPQSVSVVTRAQIDDFQLNDANALLTTVPGVTVQAQETDRFYYSARGFDIQTFQIDGIGLPFAFEVQTGSVDTAIYDRIEVVRGAPGLLSSTGNPSAVINFVRKRPTRDLKASASVQYGSFDALRLDADVSVPLTREGNVRARAVGAFVDSDSYLDRYHLRRWTGYGIVEADLGPDTVVSAGYGHQDHGTRGAMWGSLPLYYTDGTRIDHARSTNTGPDWARWNVTDRQIFGDVTHRFGDWTAKLSVLRRAISEDDRLFYVFGNPDRATGLGIFSYPGAFRAETRNLTIDAHLAGTATLFGRTHDVMFGVNRSAQAYEQGSSYDTAAINLSLPLATAFDGSFPEPNFPTAYDPSLATRQRRETVYGLIRLNPAERVKVMVGANATRAFSEGISYGAPTDYDRARFLPFVGATIDLASNISAYASFATIFNPQTQVDANRRLLDPIEGDNLQAGLKGEWLGGRLNTSIAVFQARQKNTAEAAGFDATIGQTLYRGVNAKSQGIEFEFSGQVAPGVQATGGYTVMRVRGDDDQAVRTFVPRNTGRLNIVWSPTMLPALKLGASGQYQSRIYLEPGALVPNTTTPIRITQDGYATFDLLARYDLTDRVSLSANVRNVNDAKVLNAINYDQGFFNAPRTVLGTIRVSY
ncbi:MULTISPECIES: TonB-dependent siderophore receptor [unclassified Sphingomonas]|uniref:TonB-dependent siderophore receptor n=1 Tax=unclassified Sphingomonas TaxID=196159 RepID=UPI000AC6B679|nr:MULTISPECIES: TonB-dependent siderophore receptor [unclassified Sphingomonas]